MSILTAGTPGTGDGLAATGALPRDGGEIGAWGPGPAGGAAAGPDAAAAPMAAPGGPGDGAPTPAQVEALAAAVGRSVDAVWVMVVLILIFNMQLGFILLEAGAVRRKNNMNILFKNLVDMYISTVSFWLIGGKWSVAAFGGVIGTGSNLALGFSSADFLTWLTGLFFCNTASTIVSGSLAERVLLDTYVFFTLTMCTVIYPPVAAWVWGGGVLA